MQAILFDAGNTLLWLDHDFIVSALADAGVHARPPELMAAEYDAKRLLDRLVREGAGGDDESRGRIYFAQVFRGIGMDESLFPQVAAALYARHAERNLWCGVHEHTAATLAELRRRGYRLGVVSNADGRVDALLAEVGLREHFEVVVDSGAVGVEKPDPRIFRLACEAMGVPPAETAYVGDIYEIDVVGARSAGLAAYLVDPLDRWTDLACERIRDLPDLLAHFPARG
jgi:HAD superfamily hydrolase (TIGR01549 family)